MKATLLDQQKESNERQAKNGVVTSASKTSASSSQSGDQQPENSVVTSVSEINTPKPQLDLEFAIEQFKANQYEEALEHCLEALNHHQDWPEVHDGLGWTYLNLNRLAESREAFNQAIQHQPLNPLSHKGLNEVKYRLALKSM